MLALLLIGTACKRSAPQVAVTDQPADTPPLTPAPATFIPSDSVFQATKERPFQNTLGMRFVPVPITGGPTGGRTVLFSIWDTRKQDYDAFVLETHRVAERPPPAAQNFGLHLPPQFPLATPLPIGPTHPATTVNWVDATAFCAWLTLRERAAGKLPANAEYRLPSDHEWSCAAGIGGLELPEASPKEKNGVVSGYPWGDTWPPPKSVGDLYDAHAVPDMHTTLPVGSFPANRYGLFDMAGNAYQWCQDLFDPTTMTTRVRRGSPWNDAQEPNLRSSHRTWLVPNACSNMDTFRPVIAIAPAGSGRETANGGDDLVLKEFVESPDFAGVVTIKVKGDRVRQEASGVTGDLVMLVDLQAGLTATMIAGKRIAYTASLQDLLKKSPLTATMLAKDAAWTKPTVTGKKEKVGVWSTDSYTSTWGGAPATTWVTSDIPDWSAIRDHLTKMSPALAGFGFDAISLDVPGLAVKTELQANGRKSTFTVLSLTHTTLAASEFVAPAGYTVAPLPDRKGR